MIQHQYQSELVNIIESMSIKWAYVDKEKCFGYMSPGLAEWLDVKQDDIIGMPVVDIIGIKAAEKVGQFWQQALSGKVTQFDDYVPFTRQGSRYIHIVYLPNFIDGQVEGFYVCFQDHTEQNRTIEILRNLHQFTSSTHLSLAEKINGLLKLGCEAFHLPLALISNINENTYTVKYSHTPNGEISPGDVFEASNTYCIHTLNANGPTAYNHAGTSDIKNHPCYINFGLESYIGTPLTVNGNRFGTLNFSGPEITNREFNSNDFSLIQLLSQWIGNELSRFYVERNLNRQQKLLEAMSEQGRIGAWEVDLVKNKIYWSKMTKTIHEVPEDYTPDLESAILFYKEGFSRDRISELFERALSSGEGWKEELQLITKKGTEIWVVATGNVEIENEQAIRVFGSFQDIDSRVKTELALKLAKAEAESAARSKSAFLANMSHEIRTPMNGFIGMLNILKKGDLTEEQKHYVNLASISGQSLLNIINDILDYSKAEAGKLSLEYIDFDLSLMLGDFSESIAYRAQEKGLEFILDFTGLNSNFVKGDPGRLNQILTNLVGNAIKFTHEGEVILRVVDHEIEGKCALEFTIEDTGIGIDKLKQASLFDKFTQADNSTTREYGGTGLGLSIAQQICQLMGGRISVSSEVGEGSTFSFTVIIEQSDKNTGLQPGQGFKGFNVVLVSEFMPLKNVACEQLNQWQADSVHCFSYAECIDDYQDVSQDINVLFLDIPVSKKINSAQLNTLVSWANDKGMLIIMLCAIDSCKDYRTKFSDTVHAIVPKPVTPHELINIVSMMRDDPQALSNLYIDSDDCNVEQDKKYAAKKRFIKILLVEDNLINQEVAKELLNDLDYTADIANNGREAVNILLSNQEDAYDIVLMDCQMPEMDGYEASEQIRMGMAGEANLTIPIIALTANAMKGDKQKCLDAGMDDYLSKPIDPSKLDGKISHYLRDSLK